MAVIAPVALSIAGVASAPVAVNAADTINGNIVASGGILEVKNGSGASINVTFTDPGKTPAGNAGTHPPVAVAAGATKRFKLASALTDSTTGYITVNFSATTSVTAELYY
jgi:hypothetical protein